MFEQRAYCGPTQLVRMIIISLNGHANARVTHATSNLQGRPVFAKECSGEHFLIGTDSEQAKYRKMIVEPTTFPGNESVPMVTTQACEIVAKYCPHVQKHMPLLQ